MPGELNEERQDYLRDELEKRYPVTESPAPERDSGTETTTESETTTETTTESETTTETTTTDTTTSTETTEPEPAGEVPDCAVEVFTTTCAGAACHYGAFVFPPDFQDGDIFTTLTTGTTSCDDVESDLYVDLESPDDSYLLVKVRGEQPQGCGSPMPPETDTLSAAQLSCLEDWIGSL